MFSNKKKKSVKIDVRTNFNNQTTAAPHATSSSTEKNQSTKNSCISSKKQEKRIGIFVLCHTCLDSLGIAEAYEKPCMRQAESPILFADIFVECRRNNLRTA